MWSWLHGQAFAGSGIGFKIIRFLNLLEDKSVKLSLTGFQMWATTINNVWVLWSTHDHVTQGMAMAANGAAMVAHGVKRQQVIGDPNNPQNLPAGSEPWVGEEL
ncbi:MAG: hypothetical protein KGJ13_07115 [Patescibacteria group bacterium]|nr:hypothetical protein [Patescibacteria group bacterium]